MSLAFVVALLVAVLLTAVVGLAVPSLRGRSAPRLFDAAVAALGWLGLALHCGAMFARPVVARVQGSARYVDGVNAMGSASVALYVVPAVLLLVGLRRSRRAVGGACALALLAVGVTMYDGSSLSTHLVTIFAAVVLAALASASLLARGVRGARTPAPAAA